MTSSQVFSLTFRDLILEFCMVLGVPFTLLSFGLRFPETRTFSLFTYRELVKV